MDPQQGGQTPIEKKPPNKLDLEPFDPLAIPNRQLIADHNMQLWAENDQQRGEQAELFFRGQDSLSLHIDTIEHQVNAINQELGTSFRIMMDYFADDAPLVREREIFLRMFICDQGKEKTDAKYALPEQLRAFLFDGSVVSQARGEEAQSLRSMRGGINLRGSDDQVLEIFNHPVQILFRQQQFDSIIPPIVLYSPEALREAACRAEAVLDERRDHLAAYNHLARTTIQGALKELADKRFQDSGISALDLPNVGCLIAAWGTEPDSIPDPTNPNATVAPIGFKIEAHVPFGHAESGTMRVLVELRPDSLGHLSARVIG